jgi:HupE / UreJ protein
MTHFEMMLTLGFRHITDPNGYDHILFLVALTVAYRLTDWKALVWLVTAFTVGHTLSLAAAVTDLVQVPASLIEFLIPVTILITAVSHFVFFATAKNRVGRVSYLAALVFGLIHGLGFSFYLKAMLQGSSQSLVSSLFAFNIGLELGQILIVGCMLLVGFLGNKLGVPQKAWVQVLAALIAVFAVNMILERVGF